MSKIEDGGAAFPVTPIFSESHGWLRPCEIMHGAEGMTLRDYFAAAALQGLIFHNSFGEVSDENIAKGSYQYADAMIEARKGRA
jgi:hypothetical protein